MNNLSLLIKPASSSCNMRCKYCFYFDLADIRSVKNYGIMKDDTMKLLIDNAINTVNMGVINFSFQGGEPTIASLGYFRSFIAYVKEKNVNGVSINYFLQTNGLLIDEEWCSLFKENNFLIGLSFDMLLDVHNSFRTCENLKPTYDRVVETKNMFDVHNVQYNILTVLTPELSRRPKEVYDMIKKYDIKYTQFIPCLSALEDTNSSYALNPKDFSYFYNVLFDLWKKDFLHSRYYSISLFDNVIHMIGGYLPITCGLNGKCQNHLVIESNGNTYPCDFYCIDKYKLGNSCVDRFYSLLKNDIALGFINETREQNKLCVGCKFYNICGGGCKRMTNNMYIEGDKFCGFKDFLNKNIGSLVYIWNSIKSNYV